MRNLWAIQNYDLKSITYDYTSGSEEIDLGAIDLQIDKYDGLYGQVMTLYRERGQAIPWKRKQKKQK